MKASTLLFAALILRWTPAAPMPWCAAASARTAAIYTDRPCEQFRRAMPMLRQTRARHLGPSGATPAPPTPTARHGRTARVPRRPVVHTAPHFRTRDINAGRPVPLVRHGRSQRHRGDAAPGIAAAWSSGSVDLVYPDAASWCTRQKTGQTCHPKTRSACVWSHRRLIWITASRKNRACCWCGMQAAGGCI